MARFIKDRAKSKGQAPGSLIFLGKQKMDYPVIRVMDYNSEYLNENELNNIEECIPYLTSNSVTWINIYGIHDMDLMKRIGEIFELNSLFLEDLLDTDQIPQYEDGMTYDGFILKMLSLDSKNSRIHAEQITIILGENYLLTLQETYGDVFTPVRERIRNHKGRVRLNHNDYLAYALIDTIVDNYLLVIESLGKNIEEIETRIFRESNDEKLAQLIYNNKTEFSYIRKNVRPIKDIMIQVSKSDNTYFESDTFAYLKDLNELIDQAMVTIELYTGLVSDQLNTYNTIVSNRMNSVMKVLTIFASIFIPLSFFAGVYGMNFEYIPELKYKYGYFIFWGGILLIVVGLLIYFKRKKWL